MRKKRDLGSVFEIKTGKGQAYFQYCYTNNSKIEQIIVYNRLYIERPKDIDDVLQENDSYFIGFPLEAAVKGNIVEFITVKPLPKSYVKPIVRRSMHKIKGEFLGWFIVDSETLQRQLVKELNEDQKKLSPSAIWNDTLLIENLENGWSLSKWKD